MRRSEFLRAVADEFGPQGSSLLIDLSLTDVGGRTASEALDVGVPPKDIWLALCAEMDVPLARRHGAGRIDPGRR